MMTKGCLVLISALLIASAGCQHTVRRTDELNAPLASGQVLQGQTDFGKITARGGQIQECIVQARLFAKAPTRREARELMDQSQAKLIPTDNRLKLVIEHPKLEGNRTVGGDLSLDLPSDCGLDVKTDFGHIDIKCLHGGITAQTDFGDIKCQDIAGPVRLKTDFGKVKVCQVVSQDLAINTDFGDLTLTYSEATENPMKGDLSTDFGKIKVTLPTAFNGAIEANTDFGSARCCRPIHIQGKVGKEHLNGRIGSGESRLTAKTDFGDIRIH